MHNASTLCVLYVFIRPLCHFSFFSIDEIIIPAISLPVADSIPSRPGDEFTSSKRGPDLDLIMSTPATCKPRIFAALTAKALSSRVILTTYAVPP